MDVEPLQRQHHFFISQICTEQLLCSRFYCRNWGFKRKAGQTTTRVSCSRCWGPAELLLRGRTVPSNWDILTFHSQNQSLKLGPLSGTGSPGWTAPPLVAGVTAAPGPQTGQACPAAAGTTTPPGSSWCCPQGSSPITAPSLCITHANPVPKEGASCWLCLQAWCWDLGEQVSGIPCARYWWMYLKMKN